MKRFSLLLILLAFFSLQARATVAVPTAISTIAFSNGIVTVNSNGHGLVANQGFCILGGLSADNVCETVSTATTNSFTFSLTSGVVCAALCGTVQPAKLFMIHGDPVFQQSGLIAITYCLWNFTVTPLAQPNTTSACSGDETNTSLLAEENAALSVGTTLETVETRTFPSTWDVTKVFNFLLDLQLAKQIALSGSVQPGRDSGRFCDTAGCN